MGASFRPPRPHRQKRLTALQRLHLGLLVNAQNQRLTGWIQIKADHITDFFHETGISGEGEGFEAMRFKAKGPPDATDRLPRQAAALGHLPGTPVRGLLRSGLQGGRNERLYLLVAYPARRATAGPFAQPGGSILQKAPPPFADGGGAQVRAADNLGVGAALCGQENHLGALYVPMARAATTNRML